MKPEEPLGATYGPMLEKMRLEVKNKSGVFMATTARTAESRSAAPLPPPDAIQSTLTNERRVLLVVMMC